MHSLIVGFVLENNKGLPLFDINNYINQQQGISGKKVMQQKLFMNLLCQD